MTSILTWIKANWIIVLLSAAMIICLPLFTILGASWNRSVAESIKSRVDQQANELKRVSRTDVVITPLTPGTPEINESLPLNRTILSQYEEIRRATKADAEGIIQTALSINRKDDQLLLPGLLPKPADNVRDVLPYELYEPYIAHHDALLALMNAGTPPDPQSVVEQLTEFQRTFMRAEFNTETPTNLSPADRTRLAEEMSKRRMAIYAQTASEISVYADRSVFALERWTSSDGKPDEFQWWEWQHNAWLHSILAEAIRNVNLDEQGESAPIFALPSSVVKRIVSIQADPMINPSMRQAARDRRENLAAAAFDAQAASEYGGMGVEGGGMGVEGGRGFEGGGKAGGRSTPTPSGPMAAPVVTDPDQPLSRDFTASITGRTSNGLYDVRNVTLTVIADSRRLPAFIEALERADFVTVLGMNIVAVDPLAELAMGYFYGSEPIVQVELRLETLWLREWTVPLMPAPFKEMLGIAEEESDTEPQDG